MRTRDLGIVIGTLDPGPNNAITDVPGVSVGHTTLIAGDGPLRIGQGPIRTGVTVIQPHEDNIWKEPLFAGCHTLNGNGEMTGLEWLRESGTLTSPIALTNTHSVGVVRDALVVDAIAHHQPDDEFWALPVVAETYDGSLNDINGLHIKPEYVMQAIAAASAGPVAEGNVGGGTGMICHDFKGGIGTASRVIPAESGGYIVGVLVQANYGDRERLQINGVPVGLAIPFSEVPEPGKPSQGRGSIIAVVATNAPLIPTQCNRLAQRVGLGIGRIGGVGAHSSGDIFIAFSTGNRGLPIPTEERNTGPLTVPLTMVTNAYISDLFEAVVEATEEAIVNALVAAETMTGRDGNTAYKLPHDRLIEVINNYRHTYTSR
ncbi:MAG TPA: P1 family peptidase [Ktedonobacteraceae bacterium]|nr:P1 family peptidase [Ktedonobacteraceae bacterium]